MATWLPCGDATALQQVLQRVIDQDTASFNDMRQKNLEIARESFDWDKNFKRLLAGYRQLLAT